MIINMTHCLLDQEGGTGGAVVEKEIVAIDTILRPVILHQGFPETLPLRGCQVQSLFRDRAASQLVFNHIVGIVGHSQPIVSLPLGETIDEIGFGEVENTVIKDVIHLLRWVAHPKSRMAIDCKNLFLVGRGGQ